MEYALIMNGRSYDLPKFTRSVKKEIERITGDFESNLADEKKYLNTYLFVKKMVGEDASMQIFETTNIEDIDLNEITIAFLGICSAYDRPVNDYKQSESGLSEADRELALEVIRNAGNIEKMEQMIKNQKSKPAPFKTL